jgi:GH24 family phage-related lysozyme (muramidase)/peptidoglycan hydrolase-like protein with peptidoglycan-binding domain
MFQIMRIAGARRLGSAPRPRPPARRRPVARAARSAALLLLLLVLAPLLLAGMDAVPASAAVRQTGSVAATATAEVSMEAVLKAAQWDPVKRDTKVTAGSGSSVRLVEQALKAKGLLDAKYVDGHFGTATLAAYARYQASLGFKGLDANGLPGKTSLTALRKGRYTVVRPVDPGPRTTWRGQKFNQRTKAMLVEAERRADTKLAFYQGSWSDAPASAGTHRGGAAADIKTAGMSKQKVEQVVRELRTVGFAAWFRPAGKVSKVAHIHAIALADSSMHIAAAKQAGDYYEGGDGLRGPGRDPGPQVKGKPTWEDYLRSRDKDKGDRKPARELRLSEAGADFIKVQEGFREEAYGDYGGHCTIGYGHKFTPCTDEEKKKWGKITKEEATELLWKDATEFADAVRTALGRVPLYQHEFDTLVSFTFNLGAGAIDGSLMDESLSASPPRYRNVPDDLKDYVYAENKDGQKEKLCGLYVRRVREGRLFDDGKYNTDRPDCPPGYVGE